MFGNYVFRANFQQFDVWIEKGYQIGIILNFNSIRACNIEMQRVYVLCMYLSLAY